MKYRKSFVSLFVIIVAVAALAGGARVSNAKQGDSMLQEPEKNNQSESYQSYRAPLVTGSWELVIKPTPGGGLPPELKALVTFDKGGGCVETIILPPVTTAHGAWVRTGRLEFVFVVVHNLVDPQGNFVGTVRAKSHATFIGKDQFHAEFEGNLYAPDGAVIAPISGTERGTRITPTSF